MGRLPLGGAILALLVAGASAYWLTIPAQKPNLCTGALSATTWTKTYYRHEVEHSKSKTTMQHNADGTSIAVYLASDPDNVEMHYCTANMPVDLPLGSYCFFQNKQNTVNCPTGFSEGARKFDTEDNNKDRSKPCPESYCQDMLPRHLEDPPAPKVNFLTFYYCCRNSATELGSVINFDNVRRHLPAAFVLWSKGGSCQPIRDRTVTRLRLYYDDEDDNTKNAVSGVLPDGSYGDNTEMYFCVYSTTLYPYEPSNLRVTAKTATSMTFAWDNPTIGATPSYFHVQYARVGQTLTTAFGGADYTSRTFTITGLTAGTAYQIKVTSGSASKAYETIGALLTITTCPTGWEGVNCNTAICSGSCVKGTCTAPNTCTCNTGWAKAPCTSCIPNMDTCTVCATNYYLSNGNCVQCPACNQGYCNAQGQCVCNAGWAKDGNGLCTVCAQGYYKSGSACLACSSTCLTCNNAASTCTSCPAGKYLSGSTCLSSCPSGQFLSGSSCLACQSPCATCTSVSVCQSCVDPNKVLEGTSCVNSCDAGRYPDASKVCRPCDTRCTSCTGPAVSQCTACAAGYVLNGTTCIASGTCTAGNGYISNGLCLPCHSSCNGCTGGGIADCTGCANPSHVRQGGKCQANCDTGYAPHADTRVCTACPAPCATCGSLSALDCRSCLSGRYLFGTECLTDCPAGYFKNGGVCSQCDSSCATCSGAGSSACLSCSHPSYSILDGQCVEACPPGQFSNPSKYCEACDAECSSCAGASSMCVTCSSPDKVAHLGFCLSSCPNYYFNNSGICESCDASCLTCSGPLSTECLSCPFNSYLSSTGECISGNDCLAKPGYIDGTHCRDCDSSCATCSGAGSAACLTCPPNKFLWQGACVSECPAGTFEDGALCKACTSPCATCTSASSTSCTSCNAPNVLDGTVCRSACPAGKFANDDGVCEPCTGDCATCSGAADYCLTCADVKLVVENGECKDGCGDAMYDNGGTCDSCHGDCTACVNAADYCLACASGYAFDGECYEECPPHTFPASNGFACLECDSSCGNCTSTSVCTSCNAGSFLSEAGVCLSESQCKAENSVPVDDLCTPCDSSCVGCSAPTPDSCLACSNSSLFLHDGTCVESCPLGTYVDGPLCVECASECAECTDAATCQACAVGYYLHDDVCVSQCPIGTTVNATTSHCAHCAGQGCDECVTEEIGECTKCNTSFAFYAVTGTCHEVCPDGTYEQSVSGARSCLTCPGNCELCSNINSVPVCSRCKSTHILDEDKNCVSKCPSHQFSLDGICTPCHSNCDECVGPSENECTKCSGSEFPYLFGGRCITKDDCDALEGEHFTSNFMCLPCDASCGKCKDTATSCTECVAPLFLSNSSCTPDCPTDTFREVNAQGRGVCQPCYDACGTCTGRLASNCTSCKGTDVLRTDGTCASTCVPGTYPDVMRVCQPCHEDCETCSGPNPSQCLSCNSTFVLDKGYCAQACLPGTVRQGNECVDCQSPCLSCAGTPTFCTLCSAANNSATLDGKCTTKCPPGTYSDAGVCVVCPRTCLTCNGGTENNCTSCNTDFRVHVGGACLCKPGTGEHANDTMSYQQGLCFVCPPGFTFEADPGGCVSIDSGAVVDTEGFGKTGAIVGGVIGGIAALLIILLIVMIVLRRRSKRKAKELEALMDARNSLFMMTPMSSSSRDLTLRSKAAMESSAVEATMINTQIEMALPGFLMLDYDTDLRLAEELAVGGTAVLYRAELIQPNLIREQGTNKAAVKHLMPAPNMDPIAHVMRFRQEVSIMWTLNFHPNIVKLIGFTEDPTCLVMPLYETDLARYLANEENALTPNQAFNIACQVASGLAAIHKHNCIHRDMKSPNVLMNILPDGQFHAVICDFGIARNLSAFALVSMFVVNGLSARYAAPEVFQAMGTGRTLEPDVDRACDVYAFGVIVWELVTRQTPWGVLGLEQTREAVCNGQRLPFDGIGSDTILNLLREIAESCWHVDPMQRPTMEDVMKRLTVEH